MWINDLQAIGHIPRDGNCMLHVVAQSLNALDATDYEQQNIRQMVVEWLQNNPFTRNRAHLSRFVHDFTWEEYLAKHRMGRPHLFTVHFKHFSSEY